MQYQVPQFIEMEDKIVGPLTLKQFGYLAGGGILSFALFFILKMGFAITLAIPIVAAAITMAFGKIKGTPMPKYLSAMIGFALKPQLYLWKKK